MANDDANADVPVWPLTAVDGKRALTMATEILFEPLLRKTLEEWSTLRQRCRLKSLKRQAVGRIAGKLDSAVTFDDVVRCLDGASPEEGYAMLSALGSLGTIDAPNMVVMAPYRDEADHKERWCAVVVKKALAWAEDQSWLFDTEDFLGLKD